MDILCVNQRDKASRIAVTRHIPAIFRSAQKTLVVKDGSGFSDCCVEAIGNVSQWARGSLDAVRRMHSHYFAAHVDDKLQDGVLSRLWPLQEIILSNNIQFLTWQRPSNESIEHRQGDGPEGGESIESGSGEEGDEEEEVEVEESNNVQHVDEDESAPDEEIEFNGEEGPADSPNLGFEGGGKATEDENVQPSYVVGLTHFESGIRTLAISWVGNGDDQLFENGSKLKTSTFIEAYVTNGTISRRPTRPDQEVRLHVPEFVHQFNSTRRTSKPRDFILAVMVRFVFYKVPENAKDMSFGELFVDCAHQARSIGFPLRPIITAGRDSTPVEAAHWPDLTDNIPVPTCLGDLLKLFDGPEVDKSPSPRCHPVEVQPVTDTVGMADALDIIRQCVLHSHMLWAMAPAGNLMNTGCCQNGMQRPKCSNLEGRKLWMRRTRN
jgi:hypothetical protein